MPDKKVSRRSFVKKSVAGIAGAGLAVNAADVFASQTIFIPEFPDPEDCKVKKYRPLGNLGFKASDISMGTTGQTDPSFVSFALDCGINYIDTAYSYGNGKAEKDVGNGIRGRRDKLWINTKFNRAALRSGNIEKGLMDSLDESLGRLNIDYVDSVMIHNARPEHLKMDEIHAMFGKAKKAGKVKYLGISTHDKDANKIFKMAIDDGRFNIILTVYGFYSAQTTAKYFEEAHKKGIAVVAMKTLGAAYEAKINGWDKLEVKIRTRRGQEQKVPQFTVPFIHSAFAWILDNPNVSILVKKMNSIDDVKNSLGASGMKYGAAHRQFLEDYGRLIKGNFCTIGCGDCLGSCPHGVAINNIMRYKMYFENYRSERDALVSYNRLPDHNKASLCENCGAECSGSCPNGLDIRTEMISAHQMLSI